MDSYSTKQTRNIVREFSSSRIRGNARCRGVSRHHYLRNASRDLQQNGSIENHIEDKDVENKGLKKDMLDKLEVNPEKFDTHLPDDISCQKGPRENENNTEENSNPSCASKDSQEVIIKYVVLDPIKIRKRRREHMRKITGLNLQKLMPRYPEGIWCSELPQKYEEFIGAELNFAKCGYTRLILLCLDLDHVFHCVRQSPSDYKLYDATKPLPKIEYEEWPKLVLTSTNPPDFPPAIPDMEWGSFDAFVPEDAMKLGFKIERLQVADVLKVGTPVFVMVADIYDISKFWIIVDHFKLKELMSQMQAFYKENRQRYLVPKSLLVKDLHCVVLYRSEFHRAVIVNAMPDEDYLKVFYFDYGTLGKVSKSEVWYLNRAFSEFPAQAIRSRLSNISPPYEGVTWSPFANHKFTSLACMRLMVAEIEYIDKKTNLAYMKLRCRNFYINDILVQHNYAIYFNQHQKTRNKDPNFRPKKQVIHIFPTFDEIENGLVPSLEEQSDFLNTPITADLLYPQYFRKPSHENLLARIERRIPLVASKLLTKYLAPFEMVPSLSTEEMNRIAYGGALICMSKTEECEKEETAMGENGTDTDEAQNDSISKKSIGIEEVERTNQNLVRCTFDNTSSSTFNSPGKGR